MIKVNEIELGELDVYDLEVAEKIEKELKKVDQVSKSLEGMHLTEIIKTQCAAIFEFFNTIFGEGTDQKVFGDKVNLVTCLEALDELVSQIRNQKERVEKISNKYSPNRVQRRKK